MAIGKVSVIKSSDEVLGSRTKKMVARCCAYFALMKVVIVARFTHSDFIV